METIKKIREGFAYFRTTSKHLITLREQYYWVIKINGMQGVAIEIPPDKHVNEQFASISYFSREYVIDGIEHHLLLLLSSNSNLNNDFTYICAGFLEKALDAESFQEIQQSPISWWHAMKELIGNANVEKAAYSVLSEMLSYYYLLKQEKEVSWVGPFGGTADFECDNTSYEIKSTTARYGSQITVSSQYQLKANHLIFYRFEPSINGISIQNMIEVLIGKGVQESEIEQALNRLKYPIGSEIRQKPYNLLEAIRYKVDENFPKILPESFKNDKLPNHVIGITYTLDLSGLNGEVIDFKDIL